MSTVAKPMTTEEFLALPDDPNVERWLVKGELRERWITPHNEAPMTVRNETHSFVMANLTILLGIWRLQQPEPRGRVHCGEAGVRLRGNPDTTVGVDVAYVSHEVVAQRTGTTTLIDGIPLLAAEVLSPSDALEEIVDKIDTYLNAGVPLVWIINPYHRTITIHQPGQPPVMVNDTGELSGEPHLPGLRIPVANLFV
jgi:Uma2 family endonuclease